MANGTPVGNMIIKVDLDAVGVEKSMTGLQRQLKSSNKAMGAQLSAFGRSEKSAAKYGVLIDGLSSRHRIQAQMVREARKRYDEMVATYGENSVKAQQAGQQLNEQISRYQETGRELEALKAEYAEFQRVQEIQSKGWYKAADSMEQWGGKLKSAGKVMDDTGKTLTRKVTVPLAAVGGIATKVGSDFEAGMSKVGAVSGASASEMDKLEEKAREMGATTVFSAKEASDAFYYMSLAGWDASDMLDGISGVMDLAAASGEDLALVSDIVTDGLTAFGLEAKDSARMADVLASASANANTDVSGLGQAFSYVAPVAGALGYTIEDTSKAIGLMANAGIKSTKAGTALRTMMTNLSKPTAQAQKQMDELGISITDADGNMKDFDTVMRDLRKSFGGLSKEQQAQAASTIFGKEAMSGALAIINASEEDYNNLTDAITNSDGAAKDMAETMQDNLQGSLKELKSMVEDLFITMYKNLKPAIESVVESAKDLTQWFSNLSPKTQENIVKFGLLAAAMGPVLSVTGKLTMGIGGLMQGAGALTKAIGMGKGAGLVGAMASLGPAGVAGVAIAGVTALGVAVYKMKKDTEEADEAHMELASSLTDEAVALEQATNTFEKLSDKAKLSNAELAEMHDLNQRISESANPGEIEQLQIQYNELAKKSGLSKDEIEKLFNANDTLIKQSPDVQASVSDQGNAFVESTEKVREYINTLLEASRVELEAEREQQLQRQNELKDELIKKERQLSDLQEALAMADEVRTMSKSELLDLQQEIVDKQNEAVQGSDEWLGLNEQLNVVTEALKGNAEDYYFELAESIKEKRESLNLTKEELAELEQQTQALADIYMQQVGITEQGEKGLAQLDQTIAKNDEELNKLVQKLEKGGELTEKEKERYTQLHATNEKQKEARDIIHDELGLYKDLNSLAEAKLEKTDTETRKKVESLAKSAEIKVEEGNIIKQIQTKNSEIDKSISKLENEREKNGANKKEIDEQIRKLEGKKALNDGVLEQILKELGVWDKVKDSIKKGAEEEKKKGNAVDGTKGKLDAQGKSIDSNNKKTDAGIKKEQARTKEAGKDVTKNVKATDNGTVAKIDARAMAKKMKTVAVRGEGIAKLNADASNPVTKKVNVVANMIGRMKGIARGNFYAKGTPAQGHPGGLAVVGEEGRELIHTPRGYTFVSPGTDTLMDLPRGTHVIPNRQTERLLKGLPKYATGTTGWSDVLRDSELAKLLALNEPTSSTITLRRNSDKNSDSYLNKLLQATLEQNKLLMQLLKKETNLIMNDRVLATEVEPIITEIQDRNNRRWK